jgi:hypothetical protein
MADGIGTKHSGESGNNRPNAVPASIRSSPDNAAFWRPVVEQLAWLNLPLFRPFVKLWTDETQGPKCKTGESILAAPFPCFVSSMDWPFFRPPLKVGNNETPLRI